MTSRHRYLWLAAGFLIINLVFGWRYQAAVNKTSGEIDAYRAMNRFTDVLQLVRKAYVDPEKTDYNRLIEGAISGMIEALDDPFSSYIPPSHYEQVNERTEGHFGGIGVHIDVKDGRVTIVSPIPNSPGHRAGLQPGDQIIGVDGEDMIGKEVGEVVDKIKGPAGTFVTLTVYRPSTKVSIDVDIERAIVEIESVRSSHMLDDKVGYFYITQFTRRTPEETLIALDMLMGSKMKALVIDVRDNPGGLLDSANAVCGFFLNEGDLICFTEGRTPEQRNEFYAEGGPHIINVPIVILTNGNSASGAEILAGCLSDHNRATLVGTKTYGKGSVQTIYPLADSGGLRLTVAKYYTPSKRIIHGHGIPADVEVAVDEATARLIWQTRNSYTEELDPTIDPQLAKAMEILHERLKNPDAPMPKAPKAEPTPAATTDTAPAEGGN